jgi:hypothetical protein
MKKLKQYEAKQSENMPNCLSFVLLVQEKKNVKQVPLHFIFFRRKTFLLTKPAHLSWHSKSILTGSPWLQLWNTVSSTLR